MSIKPINSAVNHQSSLLEELSFVEQANQIVRGFETGSLSEIEIISHIKVLIVNLQPSSSNLSISRNVFSTLLKIHNENVLEKIILMCRRLFVLNEDRESLIYDLEQNRFSELVEAEKAIYQALTFYIRSIDCPLLIKPFLELYYDLMERLYLLPNLSNDRASYFNMVERHKPVMIQHMDECFSILKIEVKKDLFLIIEGIQIVIQKMGTPLSATVNAQIGKLLQESTSTYAILSIIGNVRLDAGGYARAEATFSNALKLLEERVSADQPEDAVKLLQKQIDMALRSIIDCYLQISRRFHTADDLNNAIAYFLLSTTFFKKINNCSHNDYSILAETYLNLGHLYRESNNYVAAEHNYNLAKQVSASWGLSFSEKANLGLGYVYLQLGETSKVLECLRALGYIVIDPKDVNDKVLESYSKLLEQLSDKNNYVLYENLGGMYFKLKKYSQALDCYHKSLVTAKALKDEKMQNTLCLRIAETYLFTNDYDKTIAHCNEVITKEVSSKNENYTQLKISKMSAYDYMAGALFFTPDRMQDAKHAFLQALDLAYELKDFNTAAQLLIKLGEACIFLQDLLEAEKYFREAIDLFNNTYVGDNKQWLLSFFERRGEAYDGLEAVLHLQGKVNEALEIAESNRSLILRNILLKQVTQESELQAPLSLEQMQKLAQSLETTFVVYSLNFLPTCIGAWIIPPEGKIIPQSLSLDLMPEDMKEVDSILKSFPFRESHQTNLIGDRPVSRAPFSSAHFLDEMSKLSRGEGPGAALTASSFKKKLRQWYKALISPIEKYLPMDSKQTVTIVPSGFLSQLPFAAFQDESAEHAYLIEKHPILIAPSLKILQLLYHFPRNESSTSLVVGNPKTPNSEDNLELAEKEAREIVAPLLGTSLENILIQQAATVRRVIKELPSARWIHFACNGLLGNKSEEKRNPDSVFEGFFKLTPDLDHKNGYLYSEEIASTTLRAELVFMSTCYSGRGKLQQEGCVGPVWSFLAAGALSTVATLWRIPDNELTLKVIETFYRHFMGKDTEKLNKARALQKAYLVAIQKERESPHKWGAFFLSGLH